MSNILNNEKNQESSQSNLFQVFGNNGTAKNGTNQIDQKQKEIKYEYEVVQHLKQQAQKEIQRKRQIIKLVHTFIDAENRFKKEQFFGERFIYLISKNWIDQWKKYTQFELISKKKMLSLKNSGDLNSLPKMNENIVDLSFQTSIKLEKYQEIDMCIKQNLREEEDFIYANKQIISLFANYPGTLIKRQIIQVKGEKIIDLYPLKITLVLITNKILTQIKLKKRTQPIIQTLLFSKSGSAANFQLYVYEHIVSALNTRHTIDHKEVSTSESNIQYYFLSPTYQKDRLLKRIQLSLQSQLYAKEHSILIPIQPLDYKSPLSEVVSCSEPIIICEIRESSDPKQRRILYNNQKIFPFIKCPICKTESELKCICKCRHIAYCSENCENSDIQHRKKCNSKNKEGTKKVIEQNRAKNGLVGLVNLGNTCFMNSGLQCLSHIRQLTQYFLSDAYIKDINTTSNLGTKGSLAKSYSILLKNLWLQSHSTYSPSDFKKVLGGFQRNYLGYSQQDAGELITHILDALHEDLNKIKTKPYFQSKDIDYRPEHIIADEQWGHFLRRNNSKIVELMYGQFRSEVSCPECKHKSVQFDPFSMCSVPISQSSYINVIFQDDENLSEETLMIPYKEKDRLSKVIEHIRLIKNISEELKLIIYQSKTELNLDCDVHEVKLKYKANLMVRVISPEYQSLTDSCKINVAFKAPGQMYGESQVCFQKMFKFKNYLTLSQIHQIIYEQIRKLIDLGDYHKMQSEESLQKRKIYLYNERNQMDECWKCHSRCRPFQCLFPYSQKKIGQIIKGKSISLNFIIKCRLERQYKFATKTKGDGIKLLDCFTAFEDPEILTKDNAWKCPKCLNMVSAKKRMMLYKLPKILIICLKRFKKKVYSSQKNHSNVSFPLKGLDLTSKVISKELPSISNEKNNLSSENKGVIYDLFGVSYHYGEAGGGHYNAACKSIDRNAWYKFDDGSVSPLEESSVNNQNAYILFYRRK